MNSAVNVTRWEISQKSIERESGFPFSLGSLDVKTSEQPFPFPIFFSVRFGIIKTSRQLSEFSFNGKFSH